MTLLVRPAAAGDVGAVWPLARDFATSFRPERAAFEATFAALVPDAGAHLLVAADGPQVVGYLLAHVHGTFLANGPVCWVEEVMVAESHRRRGVGAALLAGAEAWAAERGAAYVSLASRRAGDFYQALGYEDSATFFKRTLPAR